MDCLETIECADGKTLNIYVDEFPENPRKWDNVGTMYGWHSHYVIGDKHDYCEATDFIEHLASEVEAPSYDDFDGPQRAWIDQVIDKAEEAGYIIFPLYLYDHSGLVLSTSPFSCPWDSGQVGWYVLTPDDIKKEWGDNKDARTLAEKCVDGEVKVYGSYINGEVYYYEVEDENGNVVDSCEGYYGWDYEENGLYDAAGVKPK